MARPKKIDHLALEAARAKEANMSYGKYKALQYEKSQNDPKPTPKKKELPRCLFCGNEIINKRKNTKYCDFVCGIKYRNQRYAEKKAVETDG